MIRSLDSLLSTPHASRTIAVAVAQDTEVLAAVESARRYGLANAILLGNEPEILSAAANLDIALENYTIIHEPDKVAASIRAVRLVRDGQADVLMKGLVDTGVVMKEVLSGEHGLRTGRLLSHVAVFEIPGYHRLLCVSDAAMNIAPDFEEKKQILLNSVEVAHALGNPDPIVAVLCAVEKVKAKMPATQDAAALSAIDFPGCQVIGPLALDNAISQEAALRKGITDPRAGHADILLMPDIEAGNIMYKAMVFLGQAKNAGIIIGAKAPIVLTSRADSHISKLYSIALALQVAAHNAKETNL